MIFLVPDVLKKDLRVVFCGTRPGAESARVKAFYAHPGNKFWRTLQAIGLTDQLINPQNFSEVLKYGIGLTDITKDSAGQDKGWQPIDAEIDRLAKHVAQLSPRVLAFTSKRAGEAFFKTSVHFGKQAKRVGSTTVFVLPSPSGLACRSWNESYWHELAEFVRAKSRRN